MSKVVKKIVTAVAVVAAVVFTGGTALLATIGKALVTAAVSIGVSRLIAKRASVPADAGGDSGARIQLPPATSNKLPIIYGTSFIGGSITDAMLSTDQKTMWYVIALAEVSDDQGGGGGSYTFDTSKCYYDGKQIQFGTNGAVTGLITNTSTPQIDTRVNGYLYVYLFNNGSNSGVNTGGLTAAQILSTSNGVPAAQAWGPNQTMTNCAFAIVKVVYSTDAGTTGAGQLMVNITNSIDKPGTAILDYMLNTRYGCGLPLGAIDTASLTALDAYSDELIDYKPVGWNPGDPYSQQARYRINGPLDTGTNCLTNLQYLVDSADSWLQYSELSGKWKVVINKKYDGYPSVSGLYAVNSSNIIGGIEVSPIDLNETFNQIEVAYPNTNIKDQTDFYIIDLFVDDPQLLSPNEAINRLNVTLPLVNNAVQARYLAARRIYQSREDLVIAFRLDFSGIQVEAGDVIRVTHEAYGWTDKLFRVYNVAETKDENGNLFADVQAFEYSDQIYDDIVEDYIPAFNTGLKDPNVIDPPGTPTVAENPVATDGTRSFKVSSSVPTEGLVLYMDFNYGNNSNVQEHRLYRTVQQSNGDPFTNSTGANIDINDIPNGDYYFSVTARNNTAGRRSNSSALFSWSGAVLPNVSNTTSCNASSNGNIITSDTVSNISIGSNINIGNGTGALPANTFVTGIISNVGGTTVFTVNNIPTTPLSNACIDVVSGGLGGNVFRPNTTPGNTIASNSLPGNTIIANTVNGNTIIANTLNGNTVIANTLNADKIIANSITANQIAANTITGNKIASNTITNINILPGTLTFDLFDGNSVDQYGIVGTYNFRLADPDTTPINIILDIGTAVGNITDIPPIDWSLPKFLGLPYTGNLGKYPFADSTASTLEGYGANSSSNFFPGEACQFVILNTDYGWYGLEFFELTSTISPTEIASINYHAQFYSFNDCQIQIAPFGTLLNDDPDYMYVNTQLLTTIDLKEFEPKMINMDLDLGVIGDNIRGVGIIMRIIGGTPGVYVLAGGYQVLKSLFVSSV